MIIKYSLENSVTFYKVLEIHVYLVLLIKLPNVQSTTRPALQQECDKELWDLLEQGSTMGLPEAAGHALEGAWGRRS